MNNVSADRRRAALQEAGEWLIRLQDDNLTDAELGAWGLWMAASHEHAAAFDDLSALWDASAELDSAALLRARERATRSRKAVSTRASAHAPRRRSPRRWLAGGIAASLLVVIGAWLVWRMPSRDEQMLVTTIGDRRHVELADGSAIDLDAASEAVVRYGQDRRDIELRRGQAFFSVAHAPERPFVVTSGDVQSRALGTRFAVERRASNEVAVTVTEGRVRITALHAQGGTSHVDATLDQQVVFTPSDGLLPPREVNAVLATAWREGTVVYQGETLANVLEDLNRYSRIPVRLQDPGLGKLRVTGRWELSGTDRWVDGLAAALHMRVTRTADGILLSRDGKLNNPTDRSPGMREDGND